MLRLPFVALALIGCTLESPSHLPQPHREEHRTTTVVSTPVQNVEVVHREEQVERRTHTERTTRTVTTRVGNVTRTTTTTIEETTGDAIGDELDGPLRLRLDERDCVDGWLSMDVDVELDGAREHFSASCGFTLHQTFSLGGRQCRAESGMCSDFMHRGEMTVTCERTGALPLLAQESFPCPDRR